MPELRVPEQINPSARAAARKVPPYYTLTQLLQMKKIRVDIQNRSDLNDRYVTPVFPTVCRVKLFVGRRRC